MAVMSVPTAPLYTLSDPAHSAYAAVEPRAVEGGVLSASYAKPRPYSADATVQVSSGFSRADRDFFRPDETIPTDPVEVIHACHQAYERFPIIRNVLDMMADFAVKGIDVVNRTPTAQAFGREWAARVGLYERSERVALTLLMAGVCPVRRETGRLPATFRRPDVAVRARKANPLKSGHLPTGYVMLDPRDLVPPVWVDPSLTRGDVLVGAYQYIPGNSFRSSRRGGSGALYGGNNPFGWPRESAGQPTPLRPGTDRLLFYKRNDYDPLPRPILFSLLRDLQVLEKLRMSDVAALDGATQRLRIFKLGDIKNGVFPTQAAFDKLAAMLAVGVGGGTKDIIWGPDLEMKETETTVHQFLGKEKYVPTMEAIFQGLGVPPTLAGGDPKSGAGLTGSFVSLRTVVERLQYVRDVLRQFWEEELELVQDALGFRHPFRLVFDEPALADEATEKKLLVDLMDRGVISDEAVLERFAADPEIEAIRVRRESRERTRGLRAPKASQFHLDASQKAQLERTYVQQGELTPSQVGLDYEPPKGGEKTRLDRLEEQQKRGAAPGGTGDLPPGDPGRPDGAKDQYKRKMKRAVPLKAEGRRRSADALVKAAFLARLGKSSARQLTAAEAAELEECCFAVLCGLGEGEVTADAVAALMTAPPPVPDAVRADYEAALETLGGATADDRRYLRGLAAAGLLDDGATDTP
jgi:hypothetical protein